MRNSNSSKVSHLAKLTPRQVRWARAAHALGKTNKHNAETLRASLTSVSFLLTGKTYTNVK